MPKLSMLPAILAAAFAFAAGPAQAEMKSQWVEYSHGDTKLKAYMAYDDKVSGKRPAVLVVHAREGMTPKTQALTELWAKLGYVSFAADIFGYGQGVLPKDVPEMQAQIAIYSDDRAADARTDAGGIRCARSRTRWSTRRRSRSSATASAARSASSSARPARRSSPMSRSTARSATITPDGRRTPRACI